MPLINLNNITQNTLPTNKSTADFQADLRQVVTSMLTQAFKNDIILMNRVFSLLWQPRNLTPQEAFDSFGSNAVWLFQVANAFKAFIDVAVPPVEGVSAINLTAPVPVTFNADGTITITE